jgi:hypothetical protein
VCEWDIYKCNERRPLVVAALILSLLKHQDNTFKVQWLKPCAFKLLLYTAPPWSCAIMRTHRMLGERPMHLAKSAVLCLALHIDLNGVSPCSEWHRTVYTQNGLHIERSTHRMVFTH